jgi:hypothetical protein
MPAPLEMAASPFQIAPSIRAALKDWSLDDKSESSDG